MRLGSSLMVFLLESCLRDLKCHFYHTQMLNSDTYLYIHTVLVRWGYHNKEPQTRWLKQQKLAFTPFSSWKSKVKLSLGSTSSKASVLGLYMAVFCLCLLLILPLCMSVSYPPLLTRTPIIGDSSPI